jgi:hypothetical protein
MSKKGNQLNKLTPLLDTENGIRIQKFAEFPCRIFQL